MHSAAQSTNYTSALFWLDKHIKVLDFFILLLDYEASEYEYDLKVKVNRFLYQEIIINSTVADKL